MVKEPAVSFKNQRNDLQIVWFQQWSNELNKAP